MGSSINTILVVKLPRIRFHTLFRCDLTKLTKTISRKYYDKKTIPFKVTFSAKVVAQRVTMNVEVSKTI